MWRLSKQEHSHKGNFSKESVDRRKLGRMPSYLALGIAWLQMTPLGYLHMSTSLMDGGDRFNPMVYIAHLEFFIQISKIFTCVELCGKL